jgi:hypothetical protein
MKIRAKKQPASAIVANANEPLAVKAFGVGEPGSSPVLRGSRADSKWEKCSTPSRIAGNHPAINLWI